MFGIGGSEWLVLFAVAVLLLAVPAIIVFGAGFFAGKRAGERGARREREDVSAADRETMDELTQPVDEPVAPGKDADA